MNNCKILVHFNTRRRKKKQLLSCVYQIKIDASKHHQLYNHIGIASYTLEEAPRDQKNSINLTIWSHSLSACLIYEEETNEKNFPFQRITAIKYARNTNINSNNSNIFFENFFRYRNDIFSTPQCDKQSVYCSKNNKKYFAHLVGKGTAQEIERASFYLLLYE